MSRTHQASRLNMQAFSQEGEALIVSTPLQDFTRLVEETQSPQPGAAVQWEARGELKPQTGGDDAVWLHLRATTSVPLTCQRCMAAVETPIEVDQVYRFVATEDIAMAEDDESEEDLLVMAPQFDLMAVLEDELLMALPLVPMHDECPVAPLLSAGELPVEETPSEKPNPFAVLSQLKIKK